MGAYPKEPSGGGVTHEIQLILQPSTAELVDGTETDVWAYNGTVPGPAIEANLGATLRITVRNELPAATTIHWHGIRVPNAMDAVPDVNQSPIASRATFDYVFTPPDAGTYWYHSHTDGLEQLARGLYGSLVVVDPTRTPTMHTTRSGLSTTGCSTRAGRSTPSSIPARTAATTVDGGH